MDWASQGWEMILSAVFGLLAFLGFRLRRDVDKLQEGKANKDSTDNRFEGFRTDFKEHVKENREAHGAIVKELAEMNGHLENMEGKLSK